MKSLLYIKKKNILMNQSRKKGNDDSEEMKTSSLKINHWAIIQEESME